MTDGNILRRPLTELQKAILDVFVDNRKATAEEVRIALTPKFPMKDSTVRTMLRRLESRGYLRHRRDGMKFMYEATMTPQKILGHSVRDIIERLCAGSAERMLIGMVDEQILSARQLMDIARMLKGKKGK